MSRKKKVTKEVKTTNKQFIQSQNQQMNQDALPHRGAYGAKVDGISLTLV